MEDSSEAHSEGNRVSPEKNSKRILKTPAQIVALENFYNEHKYPSEELKSQMAEKIGLTEKQISSWFCHRRLKDKKLKDGTFASVRQDQASGIMQDGGSGLLQDSCGSIKQCDQRNVDPREVDSEKPYTRDLPGIDRTYERTSRYADEVSGNDDTSSEGSLSSQDKFYSPMQGPSGYLPKTALLASQSAKNMAYKPSGYLKVRCEIEDAAITAVKRQLSRHYREDGPLLGVEFEPLPPGAFQSPRRGLANALFYNEAFVQAQSRAISGVRNESRFKNKYDLHAMKMGSENSFMEETSYRLEHGSGSPSRKSRHQLKLNTNSHEHSYPKESAARNACDVLPEQILCYSNRRNYRMNSKHSGGDTVFRHRDLDGMKFFNRRTKPRLDEYEHDIANNKVAQSSDYACRPSSLFKTSGQAFVKEERAPYATTPKERGAFLELGIKEHRETVRGKVHQTGELMAENKFRVELPQQEYVTRLSPPNMSQRKNPNKCSSIARQSSFSEAETLETSSSVD